MTKQDFYSGMTQNGHNPHLGDRRKVSRECDYGVWWRDSQPYITQRVTWVAETGEIYSRKGNKDEYLIMGVIKDEVRLEEALKGWENKCGALNSLQWVRDQIAQYGERTA